MFSKSSQPPHESESGFKKRDLTLIPSTKETPLNTISPRNNYELLQIYKESPSLNKLNLPPIPPEYLSIIAEIELESSKFITMNSKLFADFQYILETLKDQQSWNNYDLFINLNYLLIFYLESRQITSFADRLKAQVEVIEIFSKNPDKTMIKPTKTSQQKTVNYSENTEIIKKSLLFLSTHTALSSHFKEKILAKLVYDVRIFKEYIDKNKFIELLMERNLSFFDKILLHCKNNDFLKFYEYQESTQLVIQSFYIFIEKNMLIDSLKAGEINNEITINSKILEFCFKNQLRAIITYITDNKEHILLLPSILLFSFTYSTYDHLKKHFKNQELIKNLAEFNIITEIFKLKNNPHTFSDFLEFIFAMKNTEFKPEVQKLIYLEFKAFLNNSKEITRIIYHMNPLLIFVALSQFFYRISRNCENFHFAFVNFAEILMRKCKDFIEDYSDFEHLQTLVSNIYSPLYKSVLDIIFEDTEFFFSFFEEKRLSTIIRHNLDNSILYDFNLMNKSSIYKAITEDLDLVYVSSEKAQEISNFKFKFDQVQKKDDLQNMLQKKDKASLNVFRSIPNIMKMNEILSDFPQNEENHFYQRKVFFSAISLRFLIDFLFFTALFVYILFFTRNYTETNHFFTNVDESYQLLLSSNNEINTQVLMNKTLDDVRIQGILMNQSIELAIANYREKTGDELLCIDQIYSKSFSQEIVDVFLQNCLDLQKNVRAFKTLNENLEILFIILMAISGDIFLRKYYQVAILDLKTLNIMDFFEICNLLVCFAILLIYSQYIGNFIFDNSKTRLLTEIQEFQQALGIISLFFAFFVFLQWMRITQYIKFYYKFGFIIKTIELMVKATTIFMVIYLINIAAFCSVLYVVAGNFEDFNTFPKGMRNLFGYSLGQFSLPEGNDMHEWLISIILIIFLVITNIVLLNLLIAILSNVYNQLESRIDLENSYNFYMLHKEHYFDEKYGHLSFFPRSFNFLLLPIHLLAIFLAKPRFTMFIVDIYFSLYFFVILVFFLIANILMMPIAWAKFLVLIIIDQYYEKCEKKLIPVSIRTVHFLLWFFLGFFYLFFIVLCVDVPLFIKSAYNEITMPQKPMLMFQKVMEKYITKYLMNLDQGEKNEENIDELDEIAEEKYDEKMGKNEEKYREEEKAQELAEEKTRDNEKLKVIFEQKDDSMNNREEKVKHRAFQEDIKKKLNRKKTLIISNQKKGEKYGGEILHENSKKLEWICGGVQFEEAVKIFNFSEDETQTYK